MKQTFIAKTFIAVAMIFMSVFVLVPPTVGAVDGAEKTAFPVNGKTSNVTIRDLAVEVIRFLSIGVGIAVVAGIAVGGITYSVSQGNPSGTQKGITIITNSIVGLLLYLLMFAILQFLIPGGILT
jgi:hypothetical protein